MAQPERTFRQGCCTASVFLNQISKNGKTMQVRNVTVQRAYKNGDGWRNTNSYGINDLPKLMLVASKAYDCLTSKESND